MIHDNWSSGDYWAAGIIEGIVFVPLLIWAAICGLRELWDMLRK